MSEQLAFPRKRLDMTHDTASFLYCDGYRLQSGGKLVERDALAFPRVKVERHRGRLLVRMRLEVCCGGIELDKLVIRRLVVVIVSVAVVVMAVTFMVIVTMIVVVMVMVMVMVMAVAVVVATMAVMVVVVATMAVMVVIAVVTFMVVIAATGAFVGLRRRSAFGLRFHLFA